MSATVHELTERRPARFGMAFLAGAAVTFSLYWVMQMLISTGRDALDDGTAGRVVDFVRLKREEALERKDRKPEKPPVPERPPEVKPEPQQSLANVDSAFDMGLVAPDVDVQRYGLSASEGEYLPIVKVAPLYPERARSRGIEGWVLLEFTVTKTGAVRDPVVVASEPSGIFDRAAKRAALKFKYKPRVENGVPVEVQGVQNRIVFELED